MAIFVDEPAWPWRGRMWCHLISDESIDELHLFARVAGLRYLSFGFDHYDVPDELFGYVQSLGAEVIEATEVVRKLRRAGLRTKKGKEAKRWARRPGGVDALADVGFAAGLASQIEAAVGAEPGNAEAVHRLDEIALVVDGDRRPAAEELAEVRRLAGDALVVIASDGPWGWAIEVINTTVEPRVLGA